MCEVAVCSASTAPPVAAGSQLVVLDPVAFAVASGSATAFRDDETTLLFVRFEAPRIAFVERAYVVFDPAEGAGGAGNVDVSVATVSERWRTGGMTPRLDPAGAHGESAFDPPRAIRVDVTALVRDWARTHERERSFAIRARARSGVASVSPGVRLQLYLR